MSWCGSGLPERFLRRRKLTEVETAETRTFGSAFLRYSPFLAGGQGGCSKGGGRAVKKGIGGTVVAEITSFRPLKRARDDFGLWQPQSRDWGYRIPPAKAG